jgi:hypothetical protein
MKGGNLGKGYEHYQTFEDNATRTFEQDTPQSIILSQLMRYKMTIGRIKMLNKERGHGCVKADGERGQVFFFHQSCVVRPYEPRVGDLISFRVRSNPSSGRGEAYDIMPAARAAA